MNALLAGELLVRAELKREAEAAELEKDAASLTGAVRGAGRVIQGTASALGQGLEKEIGGTLGKGLRAGAEAAPTIGALTLGGMGVEHATGGGISRWLAAQKEKVKSKLRGGQATYDPSTGQWY